MESLYHMHIFTVEISAELIKPRVAVEAPSVHDKRVPFPVGYALSRVGSVQFLQWRVLAAVTWDHAVHRLGCNETALAGINKDEVVGKLADVGRNARTRNPRRHTVIGGIFFIGIRVEVLDHFPVFRLVNRPVGTDPAEQSRRTFRLLVIQRAIGVSRKSGDRGSAVKIARRAFTFDRQTVIGDLIWNPEQIVAQSIPDARQVRVTVRSPRRRAGGIRWSIVITFDLRKL